MRDRITSILATLLTTFATIGCTDTDASSGRAPNACHDAGTPGATARCLQPTQTPEYYADQASRYFDTLDIDADRDSLPTYGEHVARWEWPPWLLLTGYGRDDMESVAELIRQGEPSTVPIRDCRGFDTQPFARCYVVFEYERGACPIYEEFTFNDAGEMTFIEAWSDIDGLRPTDDDDRWGDADDFPRLANRVPGLGQPSGAVDLGSRWMQDATNRDADVADFAERASDWWGYWFKAVAAADPDYFGVGCGWPAP